MVELQERKIHVSVLSSYKSIWDFAPSLSAVTELQTRPTLLRSFVAAVRLSRGGHESDAIQCSQVQNCSTSECLYHKPQCLHCCSPFFPHFFGAEGECWPRYVAWNRILSIWFEHLFFFLFSLLRHSELSLLCALLKEMSTSLWKYFILLYRDTQKEPLQNRLNLFPYMRGTHNSWYLQPRLGTNLPWKIKS